MIFKNRQEYLAHIDKAICEKYGNKAAFCREHKILDCTLSRFLNGERYNTTVEKQILKVLGLTKIKPDVLTLV